MSRWKQSLYQLVLGDCLCRLLPVRPHRYLFSSFFGQHYSDGPRAISERLHQRHPEAEIWWDFSGEAPHGLPDYVRTVNRNSAAYFRVKATAAFHVTNVYQQGGYLTGNRRKDLLIRLHLRLENRRRQSVLTTWHGTPFKKMVGDQVGGRELPFVCNQPFYYAVGNAFEEGVMGRITQNKMIPLRFGSPRSVKALHVPAETALVRKKQLGLDPGDHVILYAPTFRNGAGGAARDPEASGLSQLRSLDFQALERCLRARFGWERSVLICRFHNQVERAVDWAGLGAAKQIISGNQLEDVMDYYQIADMVITDYSSVMFDFMVTRKPVLLLCPDYERYRDQERGLYFRPEELPFPFAESWEELEDRLKDFDPAVYAARVRDFMDRLGYYGDERVLDRLTDFLWEGREAAAHG